MYVSMYAACMDTWLNMHTYTPDTFRKAYSRQPGLWEPYRTAPESPPRRPGLAPAERQTPPGREAQRADAQGTRMQDIFGFYTRDRNYESLVDILYLGIWTPMHRIVGDQQSFR